MVRIKAIEVNEYIQTFKFYHADLRQINGRIID